MSVQIRRQVDRHLCDWTQHEDAFIRARWGLHPIKVIARHLGRSPRSVWRRATQDLDLNARPQGTVSLAEAARIGGVARDTAMKILMAHGVKIHRLGGRRDKRVAYRFQRVDEADARQAFEAEFSTESVAAIARRAGLTYTVATKRLRAAGLLPPARSRPGGPPIRLPINAALAALGGIR